MDWMEWPINFKKENSDKQIECVPFISTIKNIFPTFKQLYEGNHCEQSSNTGFDFQTTTKRATPTHLTSVKPQAFIAHGRTWTIAFSSAAKRWWMAVSNAPKLTA